MNKVTRDPFGIAWRIKRINPKYEIYYNNRQARYEVHANGHMEFAVAFDCLDCRTLEYARKSRVENLDAIMREIDKHNEAIERKTFADMEKKKADLAEMLGYAARTGRDVDFLKNEIKEY